MNIIEELYYSELFDTDEIGTADKDYQETISKMNTLKNLIKSRYPDCTELIEEYQSAEMDLNHLGHRNEFCKGFKAGAQLVMEMLKPLK